MSKKILEISNKLIQKRKGFAAIRYLYYGIVHDPTNAELYACLGNALKQSLEYNLALKIYRRGLSLAKANGTNALAQEIKTRMDDIYSTSPQDILKGPQIGFFIRSIMKMLTQLGKKDWF